MFRVSTRASLGLRCGVVALASAFVFVLFAPETAEARSKRKSVKRPAAAATSTQNPRYADIVVDANSGDVLHATHADATRHPASLTKIMTLYMLFERLESGQIKLDTQMPVSAFAAAKPPTKLGLKPGQTLMVEDAIKALITKSANDAATVVAEALAGSEEEFGRQMTRKARALRMTRTVYRNASGLPDPAQITTARDQALLGLAIQERFPRYYRYFQTQSFAYRGVRMSNHNRLLGSVEGVNGIKTGYIRASGFNLVTSVHRGDRRVVAVVLGGTSAAARDARMRNLIGEKFQLASTRRTAPKIVEVAAAPPALPMPPERPEPPVRVASANPVLPGDATSAGLPAHEAPTPGSTDPIRPLLVKTLSVRANTAAAKAGAPMSLLAPHPVAAHPPTALPVAAAPAGNTQLAAQSAVQSDALPPPPPGARPGVLGVLTSRETAPEPAPQKTVTASIAPVTPPSRPVRSTTGAASERENTPRSGWIVQVGAFESPGEAKEMLDEARGKAASLLKSAEPYTEVFAKGEKRFYRARFAGLRENTATQVCRELQRNKMGCFTIRN
jgi:D-alanyl-D-alanine carboxypeptidase